MKQYEKLLQEEKQKSAILNDRSPMSFHEVDWQPSRVENVVMHSKRLKGLIDQRAQAVEDLEKQWIREQRRQENEGKQKPVSRPKELQQTFDETRARLKVAELELEKVHSILDNMDELKPDGPDPKKMLKGRLGSSTLRGGIMDYIDNQNVSLNKNGTLAIDEKDSPYDTMLVLRYVSAVAKPVMREWALRDKIARKNRTETGGAFRKTPRPKLPIWDKKTDKITYPGYSEKTLQKLPTK